MIVLFNRRYAVQRATLLQVGELTSAAREDRWVSGQRVIARDDLLDRGRDLTERLRRAAAEQDD